MNEEDGRGGGEEAGRGHRAGLRGQDGQGWGSSHEKLVLRLGWARTLGFWGIQPPGRSQSFGTLSANEKESGHGGWGGTDTREPSHGSLSSSLFVDEEPGLNRIRRKMPIQVPFVLRNRSPAHALPLPRGSG